jgi:hypothetical protein
VARVVIGRPERGAPDGGSMPLAVLLTVVAMGLSALLASMVRSEIVLTRADTQRLQALSAAQAGLDVALAHILATTDGATHTVFDLTALPWPRGTFAGAAGGTGSGEYTATVSYFKTDPQGPGPIAATTFAEIRFALISATGDDGAGGTGRTLTATYTFPDPLSTSGQPRLHELGEG